MNPSSSGDYVDIGTCPDTEEDRVTGTCTRRETDFKKEEKRNG